MVDIKLYAFRPQGHGPLSYFVAAESEEKAREAVDNYINDQGRGDSYYTESWDDADFYVMEVAEPGQVMVHDNA